MWRCVTKELFVSPCMQHVMCGIPMIELHQDRAIYKVGAPRKACYRISEAFHDTMITRQKYTLSTLPLKTITGSQTTTLGALQLHDSQFDIRLEELTTSDTVQEFKAVIFKDSTIVNLGEFIELVTPYDQVHAAAAPILVELTCCIIPLDAVWTSSNYFQHFF